MTATLSPVAATAPNAGQRLLVTLEHLSRYYHERGLAGEQLNAAELDFCVGLARYHLAPPLARMLADRVHVMVFGGAGAGKSTVANMLVGSGIAEVNPQAGYTRFPTGCYRTGAPSRDDWPERLGPLHKQLADQAADLDENRFQVLRLLDAVADGEFLNRIVVWDSPDLTTKDSRHYEHRAIEIAALAHVGVYVASDERYNDELPTHFLQAVLDAGKPVVVALTKVNESDADELVRLFEQQVVAKLRRKENIVAIIAIPSPGRDRLGELWTDAFPYGQQLREAATRAGANPESLRRRLAAATATYLQDRQSRLLDPLRRDVGEWQAWAEQVRRAANEAVRRYERDYLERINFPEFQIAAEKLLKAFEPTGPLQAIWHALEWVRLPVRWLAALGQTPAGDGRRVDADTGLDRVRRGMVESLQVAAAQRKSRHHLWTDIHGSIDAEMRGTVEPAYRRLRERQQRDFEHKLRNLTEAVAAGVASRPQLAGLLQFARLAVEAALVFSVVLFILRAQWSLLFLVILIPLALGLLDLALRYICERHVASYRAGLMRQQRDDLRELVQSAYIDNLLRLPRTAGAPLAELAGVAEQLPKDLAALSGRAGGPRP